MGIIEDLTKAIHDYATEYCTLTVVDLSIERAVLNAGEKFSFKVKVANNGHIRMESVLLGVETSAHVQRDPDYFIGPPRYFDVPAHKNYTDGPFFYQALRGTNGAKDILTVKILEWNASLEFILKKNTEAGATGVLNLNIEPD